jgi:hypothetical protein
MLRVDLSDVRKFEKDLGRFVPSAFAFATRSTVNGMAFKAQSVGRKQIGRKMIERSKFTRQTVQVDQTRTLDVDRQAAVVGAVKRMGKNVNAGFLEKQEFGGVKTKTHRYGTPIATSFSSGEGEGSQPRRRLPISKHTIRKIILHKARARKKGQPKTKKQKMLFKVQDAVESGNRVIFAQNGRKKGIFRVVGGRKGTKRGWPKGARLKMLHNLSRDSVRIPRNPWLSPAVEVAKRHGPEIYLKALKFQVERHGLFSGR